MKIILTDSYKACPQKRIHEHFHDIALIQVTEKTIMQYVNNPDVIAIVGSRSLAQKCQSLEFPNCRLFQLFSTGFDDVDISLYKTRGIVLCNAKNIYDQTVAEYAVYMMLTFAKRYHRSLGNRLFRPFRNYHYFTELKGKTVGIMGVGNIGSRISEMLQGFDVHIVGYAQHTKEKAGFEAIYHHYNIDEFLSQCDFLINTLPHCKSTISLLDKDRFANMKHGSVFINVGRESIYDYKSLVNHYRTNKESTAILDIFELIPNPFSPLHRLSNIYVTPRVAAYSKESDENLIQLIISNLKAYIQGEGEIVNIIN